MDYVNMDVEDKIRNSKMKIDFMGKSIPLLAIDSLNEYTKNVNPMYSDFCIKFRSKTMYYKLLKDNTISLCDLLRFPSFNIDSYKKNILFAKFLMKYFKELAYCPINKYIQICGLPKETVMDNLNGEIELLYLIIENNNLNINDKEMIFDTKELSGLIGGCEYECGLISKVFKQKQKEIS